MEYLLPYRQWREKVGIKYLDEKALASPSIAFGNATREIMRMADIVEEMLSQVIEALRTNDVHYIEKIKNRDNQVDLLEREIRLYLVKISRKELTDRQADREAYLLTVVNNLENIGDVVVKNLMELAAKRLRKGLVFSEEGWKEIVEFHRRVMENYRLATIAFATGDVELAQKVLQEDQALGELQSRLHLAHIERLQRGLKESIETSSVHLDVINNLRWIDTYIAGCARDVVEGEAG